MLEPQPTVSAAGLEQARQTLVLDSAWASVCGALFGGVVLSGFAVQAGAGPLAIGLLAAIPYIAQEVQLPATLLVERHARRKRLSVLLLGSARVVILALALLPLWPGPATLPLLLLGKLAICACSAVAACALNSWMHQLLSGQPLGSFFSRRLAAGTARGTHGDGHGGRRHRPGHGSLGLKLAPAGEGASYLAAVGLVSSAAGGLAPLVAGALGQWLQSAEFSLVLRWASDAALREFSVLRFEHYEFLFAMAGLLGLYVMHALSRMDEGTEVSERRVMQELLLEARQTVDQLSSLGGTLGSLVSFERLNERRLWFRRRPVESRNRTGAA